MKFTSSPWGFRFWDFDNYCNFMKKIGITDICVHFGDPLKLPLAFDNDTEKIEKNKKIADGKGVRIIEASITYNYKHEIPLISFLGAKYVRLCDVWEESEESFKRVGNLLKEIGEVAGKYNLTLIVENHGGLMSTGQSCKKLIEEVGMENVKINYDPANFLYYGEDPIKAIDYILPYIGFTHFKGVKFENKKPRYCRLKEGVIDYKRIFEKLLPFYTGYIGLEYEEPTDVEKGTRDDFEYMKSVLKEVR
ncbi:MAG TPA: sugar phosphate isomerase/epimerase family protein [Victivallales bacterium]|mgnify:CR=1 FL=1|nr:sugar phosphate isomerase/epimerase family protein [Victivallales bacterium]